MSEAASEPLGQEAFDREASRVRLYRVSVRDVLNFVYCQNDLPRYVAFPRCKDSAGLVLPPGFSILGVHSDFPHHVFRILVRHPSFDVVQPGNIPPGQDLLVDSLYQHCLATDEEMETRRMCVPLARWEPDACGCYHESLPLDPADPDRVHFLSHCLVERRKAHCRAESMECGRPMRIQDAILAVENGRVLSTYRLVEE